MGSHLPKFSVVSLQYGLPWPRLRRLRRPQRPRPRPRRCYCAWNLTHDLERSDGTESAIFEQTTSRGI
ncbi:hypothetical protein LIA77_09301 [Sarocladium implicatum]|nr:hypothetical protein LIA77_09301 [Sarocladium implicatum]